MQEDNWSERHIHRKAKRLYLPILTSLALSLIDFLFYIDSNNYLHQQIALGS